MACRRERDGRRKIFEYSKLIGLLIFKTYYVRAGNWRRPTTHRAIMPNFEKHKFHRFGRQLGTLDALSQLAQHGSPEEFAWKSEQVPESAAGTARTPV